MSRRQWGHGFWTGYAQGQKTLDPRVFVPDYPSACCAGCQEIARAHAHDEDAWQLAEIMGVLVAHGGLRVLGNEWYLHCLRHQQPWIVVYYEEHHGVGGFSVEADFRPSRRLLTDEGFDILFRWLQQYTDHAEVSPTGGGNVVHVHLAGVPIADARTFAQLILVTWYRDNQPIQECPDILERGRYAREIDRAAEVLSGGFDGRE